MNSDFQVSNHGNVFLLLPVTAAAREWVEENLPEDRLMYGGSVAVEHRFIADIVQGIQTDGLRVS